MTHPFATPAARAWTPGVAALVASLALSACGPMRQLTRVEGDGGWSAAERAIELQQRAHAAAVDLQGAAPAGSDAPLTLAEVLAAAERHDRRIAEAQTRVQAAAAQVRDARGRLLPGTVAGGRYTWYTDEQSNQIDLPAGVLPADVEVEPITIRPQHFGTLNATLTLPIDLSGEFLQMLAAAQAGYRGEQARAWAVTLERQTAALRAYYQLLEAQSLRRVTEQNIELDRRQVATAEARFANGRITKNDLLIVQVALSNAEQSLRQRDVAVRRARRALNDVLGLPIEADTTVVDVESAPLLPAVDAVLREAYLANPLLGALLEERQRLEANASALRRSRLPRFAAGGAVDHTSADIVAPQTFGSGFTGFTWDLGTDLRREAQIAQAEHTIEQNQLALERQIRELEAAIRTTHDAARERLDALASAREAVVQAEENLRIRQQQFDVGRAQSDDVLRAQAALTRQRAVLASALYQAHIRRAELQQLSGRSLTEIDPTR